MTIRNLVFASLIGLVATSAAACAADPGADGGPRLVNRNGDEVVEYGPGPRGNVAGGAFAAVTGGKNDRTYTAAPEGARAQAGGGPVAVLSGGGDNMQLTYVPAAPSATLLARRR